MASKTKEQIWFCDMCKKRGAVNYEKGDDVYTVLNLIDDAHQDASPECRSLRMALGIINPDKAKLEDYPELMAYEEV